jgi:hypothetical protein
MRKCFCDEFRLHRLLETQDEGHGFSRAVRYGAHEAFRPWVHVFLEGQQALAAENLMFVSGTTLQGCGKTRYWIDPDFIELCQPRTSVRGSGFSNPRERFISQ